MPTITETMVRSLMELWQKEGKGKLSYGKAEKRLKKAAEHGCLLLDDCTKCPKVLTCPLLNLDDGKED